MILISAASVLWMPNRCACVCVCQGKGVPDVNSRLMVRKLWDTLHIPTFALVDADPHGTSSASHTYFTYFHTFNCTRLFFSSPRTHSRVACPTKPADVSTCHVALVWLLFPLA